jgi:hypothetical protein
MLFTFFHFYRHIVPHWAPRHIEHLDTTDLEVASHGFPDLAAKVTKWSKQRDTYGNLSPLQQSALAAYRTDRIFNICDTETFSDQKLLQAYFVFFDKLYFGGKLEGRCKLRMTNRKGCIRSSPLAGETYMQQSWIPPRIILKTWCYIWVFTGEDVVDAKTRRLYRIGVLLHEMVHAFLLFYGCCGQCSWDIQSDGYGHRFAWQDAAYVVEKASRDPVFLNLPIDLDRYPSMVYELLTSKAKPPADADRWELNFQKLESHITELKKLGIRSLKDYIVAIKQPPFLP